MSGFLFASHLLDWFDLHGRKELPWQQDKSAYNTWVSEIMLQQTQVSTVIPYYERFMERFPSVQDLASADLDEVLHLWTGLGYYARARNLHRAANQVVSDYQGRVPTDPDELESLPGIGRSTAGAIASIAGGIRAPILDGNVKRVLARYIALDIWPGSPQGQKQLWQIAEALTPNERVGDYTQAIMDLGATVCTRSNPNCARCPFESECQASYLGLTHQFPIAKPKKQKPVRTTHLLIIQKGQELLLKKRPPAGIWGGLWCFAETDDPASLKVDEKLIKTLQPIRHTFSHFHLDMTPLIIDAADIKWEALMEDQPSLWYNTDQPPKVGLAAPVKKLLMQLSQSSHGETA